MIRQDNTTRDKGHLTTRERDFEFFDALPPAIRAAIRDLPENISTESLMRAAAREGWTVQETLWILERQADQAANKHHTRLRRMVRYGIDYWEPIQRRPLKLPPGVIAAHSADVTMFHK